MKDNLHIVNLASYNRPKITEDPKKEWINYGDNNDYYQYLIDLYINSTTNHSIISSISQMIYGKGIDALDSNKKPNEYAAMRSILSDHCLRKVVLDLKLLGEGSFQILYKDSQVVKAEHFPRQTLRAEKCNEDGVIEAYYYFHDWSKLKTSDEPKRIASFGFGNGTEPEIKICKKYVSGYDYYCPVDYAGGLAFAELESEISDYLINDVQQGFSGTKIVNFNNGVPDREQQLQVKNDVMNKLTGSRGEKVIIAFNNNAESKTTVDDIPLNDAPAHYEYLSNECSNKLIVAHRVTSPLLLGIRTENNGLGSNADEIKTAALLFDNITIKPYQHLLVDCIDDILAVNGISLKLYFKTLQPLEFIETDNAITDEAREEETGIKDESLTSLKSEVIDKDFAIIDDRLAYATKEKAEAMAKNIGCEGYHEHEYNGKIWFMPCKKHNLCLSEDGFNDDDMFVTLDGIGKDEESLFNEGYELVDERPVNYEQEEALDKMIDLASVVPNKATAKSGLDGETKTGRKFLVRYQYAPLIVSNNTRAFCKKMVKAKKVYRKEDLDKQSTANKELAAKGESSYNIFFHKGGANCHHYWLRKTYIFKGDYGIDPNSPNAKPAYAGERAKEGIKAPTKSQEPNIVGIKPKDTPTKGYKN